MGNPFVSNADDGMDGQPLNLDPKNLWCIHGKRYDLRLHDFLDRHPGAREPLCRRGRWGRGGASAVRFCGLLRSNDSSRLSAGGRTHLELSRGRDVTELFESYHALVDAPNTMMSKYLAEDQEDVPQLSFDWCATAVPRPDVIHRGLY